MLYNLECPVCHEVTEAETETPILEWVCDNCGAEPITSLPTDEEGNLI